MATGQATVRSIGAGVCLAVAASLLVVVSTAPAHAATAGSEESSAARASAGNPHNVTGKGPSTMRLRTGCRETYSLTVSFDVAAGEHYDVTLRGQDSQGHTINGSTVTGTATSNGRRTIKRSLLLCGETHDGGVGKLQIFGRVGEQSFGDEVRTVIRYADRVRMKKPKRAVKRGKRVLLRGQWDRGRGFGLDCGYYNRKAVRVRIFFKPNGGSWRQISKVRISAYGDWHKKVKVKRSGKYQVRIKKSKRYLPTRSKVRRVRAR